MGFDPGFERPMCLATLQCSVDDYIYTHTHTHIYIYIYIYIYIHSVLLACRKGLILPALGFTVGILLVLMYLREVQYHLRSLRLRDIVCCLDFQCETFVFNNIASLMYVIKSEYRQILCYCVFLEDFIDNIEEVWVFQMWAYYCFCLFIQHHYWGTVLRNTVWE